MIRVIIVDDEPHCTEYLKYLLTQYEHVQIVGTYNYGQDALAAISNYEIDVAFLDIDMPEIDGLTLAEMIVDIQSNVSVVFVTAYNEYAVDAFKINALDYILKPASKERIAETLNRLLKEKNPLPSNNKIFVNCFGKFSVSSLETKELVKWNTSKSEELFAYLVSNRGQDTLVENINSDVFPEMNGEKAYNNIKTTIYYIKKTLGKIGATDVIIRSKGAYRINPELIECNYYKFLECTKKQQDLTKDTVSICEEIIESTQDGFLEDNCYMWSEEIHHSIQGEFSNLCLTLSEHYMNVHKYRNAEKLLKKVLRNSPLHYPTNKMLIELYLKMNDRIYALKTFDSYKRKLRDEFGEIPPKEMSSLLYLIN